VKGFDKFLAYAFLFACDQEMGFGNAKFYSVCSGWWTA